MFKVNFQQISKSKLIFVRKFIRTFVVLCRIPSLQTFSNYQLNAQFFYSSTICMLHYDPQHVSSSTLLVLRRTNCIITASGIVTLCKRPYSMQVESGLQSALNRHTVRLFTESDDTRGCSNTICPPEDEQRAVRNMLRIVV